MAIRKIEKARILCGDFVEISIEECLDGTVNIEISEMRDHSARLGFRSEHGIYFPFWRDVKQPSNG